MKTSGQLLFALLSGFLLPGLSAGEPKAALSKRIPTDVANWDLYKYWDFQTEQSPYYCDQDTPDVPVGTYTRKEKKLEWSTKDCGTNVAQWTSTIAAGEVSIYKGTLATPDGKTVDVAVKRGGEDSVTGILYGAYLQSQFNHENILPVLAYVVQDGNEWAQSIMPYVSASSLDKNFGNYDTQDKVNDAFLQMLTAVSLLQDKGIIHRDLKPENYLVESDGTLKLIDFDTAIKAEETQDFNVGTRTYIAPGMFITSITAASCMKNLTLTLEIITMDSPFSNKVDTFALGMSFLVMSESTIQNEDDRFELWKDLIVPNGVAKPSADTIATLLKSKNYAVFDGNDSLLQVIAKSLCEKNSRYDPQSFQTAFKGAI